MNTCPTVLKEETMPEETDDQYKERSARVLQNIKSNDKLDLSVMLNDLASIGFDPSLIYDDNGKWACGGETSFGSCSSEPGYDFHVTHIIKGDDFRECPKEALMVFVDEVIAMDLRNS